MGREVGGRGTHVNPWLIHVNVWQKPLQYCKVISLQLIKIIGGKNKIQSFAESTMRCTSPVEKRTGVYRLGVNCTKLHCVT